MAMSRKRSPSYLLTRGRIVAMDDAHCVHQAILLRDGLVAWVGDSSDAPAADIRIDLQGATVIPGLTDAHLHLLAVAQESCLLYTSDAADERSSVDLGGRRIIKKTNNNTKR